MLLKGDGTPVPRKDRQTWLQCSVPRGEEEEEEEEITAATTRKQLLRAEQNRLDVHPKRLGLFSKSESITWSMENSPKQSAHTNRQSGHLRDLCWVILGNKLGRSPEMFPSPFTPSGLFGLGRGGDARGRGSSSRQLSIQGSGRLARLWDRSPKSESLGPSPKSNSKSWVPSLESQVPSLFPPGGNKEGCSGFQVTSQV